MASIEEKVEEHYKKILDELGIRHYGKTESINRTITDALRSADSKSGGSGNNYPDIQLLLENKTARRIPVMIEAKGLKNRLEKISKSGQIELITYYEKDSKRKDGTIQHHAGDANYSSIMNYAVNGAVHYANAILDSRGYTEVIAIGINGTQMNADGSVQDAECRAYYISEKNNRVPKHIPELDKDWSLLKADNLDRFFAMLDKMTLTEKELEDLRQRTETALETKIKSIHQSLYDDPKLRTALTTNEKLYLFCGLIMVGLTTKGVAPLDVNQFTGNDDQEDNDSTIIITRIRSFLKKKKCGDDKIRMILDLLQPVFKKETLWRPVNGESILKSLFKQVKQDIIPCLESNLHLDFTGKILNSLGDWVHIENDRENDVVLTPRYVTTLMAKLARTNMDSFVWDRAMGSAGFLVSAMDIMIKDAQAKIHDQKELEKKITNIKEHQLLGVEILGNIYILAVLNMILMGDGSSNIYNGDGHDYNNETGKFPATVFLLNPPYSADGKGFNFVQEALEKMTSGYACILIQENAGSGNGLPYTKKILEKNTLCASVHMSDIFCGKSSVQTAIYVFQVARPHEVDDMVIFIDFSNDGYARQNRKKSSQEVNLRDADHAAERYAEVEAIVLGKKPRTQYYTEENGLVIRDTVSLNGNDWTFAQHKVIDTMPTEEDFRKTVADYLAWKVSQAIKGDGGYGVLIQTEYKELLATLLPKLKSRHSPEALDEINLFWLRHIEEIQLYLKAWFPGENSYVFTAATFMDFEDNEHLPFLLMGDKHILDDPLSKYSEIRSKMPDGKDAEFLYEQIGVTAEDNLKLLENVHGEILILPLRLLNQSNDYHSLYSVGGQAFISLFNGIDNLNDYFAKCNSIDDIIRFAREDIGRLVMFSEDDNVMLPFGERFRGALSGTKYMVDRAKPDSYNFFILVFGCIQQAIDVIVSCVEYGCIPYIRYPVSLHYISLLSESMLDIEHMVKLRFKMSVAFVVYQLCDKGRLARVSLEEFLKQIQAYNFNEKLFRVLAEHDINENSFLGHTITQLVIDELEAFYNILAEESGI